MNSKRTLQLFQQNNAPNKRIKHSVYSDPPLTQHQESFAQSNIQSVARPYHQNPENMNIPTGQYAINQHPQSYHNNQQVYSNYIHANVNSEIYSSRQQNPINHRHAASYSPNYHNGRTLNQPVSEHQSHTGLVNHNRTFSNHGDNIFGGIKYEPNSYQSRSEGPFQRSPSNYNNRVTSAYSYNVNQCNPNVNPNVNKPDKENQPNFYNNMNGNHGPYGSYHGNTGPTSYTPHTGTANTTQINIQQSYTSNNNQSTQPYNNLGYRRSYPTSTVGNASMGTPDNPYNPGYRSTSSLKYQPNIGNIQSGRKNIPTQQSTPAAKDTKKGSVNSKKQGNTTRVITCTVPGLLHWSRTQNNKLTFLFELYVSIDNVDEESEVGYKLTVRDLESNTLKCQYCTMSHKDTTLTTGKYYRILGKMVNNKFCCYKISEVSYMDSKSASGLIKQSEIAMSKFILQINES